VTPLSAEGAFTKLTQTFAAQMEALKRYRTGGEQKAKVQHVTVGDGGQAIVANVHAKRRRTSRLLHSRSSATQRQLGCQSSTNQASSRSSVKEE
jgi:hypothetical protein